jgi:hypothetical protein
MAKLITQDLNGEKVSFYFGTRIFALMETEMGIEDMSQLATRFEKPKFSDIATMLFLAHENACFINKKDLVINNVDEIYQLIDELGIDVAQEILADGITSLMNVKKIPAAKKKTMKP